MRTIKFRAWDGKKMLPAESLSQSLNYRKWLGKVDVLHLQYTGLKDKNGTEIYEGDVVVVEGEYPWFDDSMSNYVGVVEMIFGCWQYVYKCVNPLKRGVSDGINGVLDDSGHGGKEYTVIGNIHEHPELLGAKTEV